MDIKYYRELLAEWAGLINGKQDTPVIESIHLGVLESHLIRKIRDKKGVLLCANYPDFKRVVAEDSHSNGYRCVLYLIEKVPSGSMTDEQELMHYAKIEQLMKQLVMIVQGCSWVCNETRLETSQLKVEWEYDIFGGFNGQSLSFKMEEYTDD